jgi:hypothetical protein
MLQREAQIQYNVSNNQTTGIMDTVSRLLCLDCTAWHCCWQQE